MKKTINVRVYEEMWLGLKVKLSRENKKNGTRKTMLTFVEEITR